MEPIPAPEAILGNTHVVNVLEIVISRLRDRAYHRRKEGPKACFDHEENAAIGEADGLDEAADELEGWVREVMAP